MADTRHLRDFAALAPGCWTEGDLPPNVVLGPGTIVTGDQAFKRLRSTRDPALVVGEQCALEQVQFSYGLDGQIRIGDLCVFSSAIFKCDMEIRVGSRVVIGWHTYIADSDFHPLDPMRRIDDAIACSPLGAASDLPRPDIRHSPVVIGDDVWIGPGCTVLKGVTIGDGAFVEPGSLVTADVPSRSRVMGNPARVVGSL